MRRIQKPFVSQVLRLWFFTDSSPFRFIDTYSFEDTSMKKSLLLASLIAAMALAACGKKAETAAADAASAATDAASVATAAASAATETASAATAAASDAASAVTDAASAVSAAASEVASVAK
jgi:type IV secretory pathway TrbL component